MEIENTENQKSEDLGLQENVIEFLRNQKTASVTFVQGKYVSKIRKLAEQFPEQCQIIADKDGVIFAHIPTNWVKISTPKKISEEQREKLRIRLAENRDFIDDLPFTDFGYEEEYEDEE